MDPLNAYLLGFASGVIALILVLAFIAEMAHRYDGNDDLRDR